MPYWIVVFALIVLLVLLLPTWPYSHGWGLGYYPSGFLGILLIIVLILLLSGRL